MKKMKILAIAVIASFALVACNSTDSLLKKYEKAVENGDVEAVEKYSKKLNDRDLDEEQQARFDKATIEFVHQNDKK